MKIAVVIPPSPYMTSDTAFPSLGPLYFASYARKEGHNVKVFDLTGEKNYIEKYALLLKKNSPDCVGFASTTPDIPYVVKLFRETKKISKNILTLIGGHHATIIPESLSMFDKVVIGDGFCSVDKIINSKEKFVKNKISDIKNILMPARDLIDLKKYNYTIKGSAATSIISHLGCPYKCTFCCGRALDYYSKLRFRDPKSVVEEMDYINKTYGYRAFMFYDDEFNADKNYSMSLAFMLTKRKYLWRAPMRANLLDKESVKLFKKSGCVEITVGVESGSDRVLKLASKGTTTEINTKARKLALKYGIRFKAFIVVGLPFSTKEDEELTEKWIEENKPDDIDVTPNTPYPSTPQYENPEKYKLKFKYDFFKENISFKYDPNKIKVYCENSFLTKREIKEIILRLLKKYKI